MSSFNILGFFKLKSGRRISVQKPPGTMLTMIKRSGTSTKAPSPPSVFSSQAMLPCCRIIRSLLRSALYNLLQPHLLPNPLPPIPGDPSTDAYNDQLPDERTSMVFGVGRITGSPQTLDDGHSSRVVTLAIADYVRCEEELGLFSAHGKVGWSNRRYNWRKDRIDRRPNYVHTGIYTTILCVFDLSTARWTRAPVPQANSVMQFYGLCRDVNPAGLLRIKLESVALNISSNGSAPSADSQSPSHTITSALVTPSKQRKFSSPSPPSTGPDPPSSAASSAPSASPSKITDPSLITVAETAESATAPMHYSRLFQQYPQYMGGGPATRSSFPSRLLSLFSPGWGGGGLNKIK
ncbi:hypothetical protein DFH08DRAFT_1025080 [Mycena albidolilacea]|uniref:Uncharacterized protein n=1 Tax=Mycena albidolilacea TaxID=1033008 RepID=A0AAD7AM42_9AGAR|nr:hypothetical protein DFH08DRAFT_1025080 [Mycena albidolilacea]